MKILDAKEAHYPGIVGLIKSEDELFLVYPGGSYPFTVGQVQELAEKRHNPTVAVENDQVIGFANLYGLLEGKSAFIGNVVVADTHRGQGIGRKLVQHMLDLIFNHYQADAHISVFGDNTPALLLYKSFGFTPYDTEERKKPNGNRIALIHMILKRDH